MQFQLDWGNFAVGIGTSLTALVTLFVASKSIRCNHNQKVAEFRKEWVENLRLRLADFYSFCEIVSVSKNTNNVTELHEYMKKASFALAYLKLMLNENEADHKAMSSALDDLLAKSFLSITDVDKENFEILARKILKTEWDRVKATTKS